MELGIKRGFGLFRGRGNFLKLPREMGYGVMVLVGFMLLNPGYGFAAISDDDLDALLSDGVPVGSSGGRHNPLSGLAEAKRKYQSNLKALNDKEANLVANKAELEVLQAKLLNAENHTHENIGKKKIFSNPFKSKKDAAHEVIKNEAVKLRQQIEAKIALNKKLEQEIGVDDQKGLQKLVNYYKGEFRVLVDKSGMTFDEIRNKTGSGAPASGAGSINPAPAHQPPSAPLSQSHPAAGGGSAQGSHGAQSSQGTNPQYPCTGIGKSDKDTVSPFRHFYVEKVPSGKTATWERDIPAHSETILGNERDYPAAVHDAALVAYHASALYKEISSKYKDKEALNENDANKLVYLNDIIYWQGEAMRHGMEHRHDSVELKTVEKLVARCEKEFLELDNLSSAAHPSAEACHDDRSADPAVSAETLAAAINHIIEYLPLSDATKRDLLAALKLKNSGSVAPPPPPRDQGGSAAAVSRVASDHGSPARGESAGGEVHAENESSIASPARVEPKKTVADLPEIVEVRGGGKSTGPTGEYTLGSSGALLDPGQALDELMKIQAHPEWQHVFPKLVHLNPNKSEATIQKSADSQDTQKFKFSKALSYFIEQRNHGIFFRDQMKLPILGDRGRAESDEFYIDYSSPTSLWILGDNKDAKVHIKKKIGNNSSSDKDMKSFSPAEFTEWLLKSGHQIQVQTSTVGGASQGYGDPSPIKQVDQPVDGKSLEVSGKKYTQEEFLDRLRNHEFRLSNSNGSVPLNREIMKLENHLNLFNKGADKIKEELGDLENKKTNLSVQLKKLHELINEQNNRPKNRDPNQVQLINIDDVIKGINKELTYFSNLSGHLSDEFKKLKSLEDSVHRFKANDKDFKEVEKISMKNELKRRSDEVDKLGSLFENHNEYIKRRLRDTEDQRVLLKKLSASVSAIVKVFNSPNDNSKGAARSAVDEAKKSVASSEDKNEELEKLLGAIENWMERGNALENK